ncbi:hypothetical protein [Rubinisphaera sp.]|uniref:hypothetical protein n=1 Tax=Rubinisphaera sp. TaxID=2024857 RepID=UPI000C0ED0D1|nr:hypothetical protein [Rubinisphaera sp.]MBV11102.1 hypothetical protein [Rubinisphaera sp.]HCS51471.1 hypothetical protein [Planctomycetaceae bacterium]|tara:strand:+ start:3518 stop:4375 length:858 start_codon:yes stop_codon:yes gene_type:complete
MKSIKRLSLQLTPLLDLLLIVIFAQYLEMEQTTQAVTEKRTDDLAVLEYRLDEAEQNLMFSKEVLAESQRLRFQAEEELKAAQQMRAEDQLKAAADQDEMSGRLKDVSDQRDKILTALKTAYQNSSQEISKIIEALSKGGTTPQPIAPEKVEELAKDVEQSQPRDLATFLLAYEEIRKRCDIWEIHINSQEVIDVHIGEKTFSIRAVSEDDFQQKLFNLYKSLPQTKGLVIILVSYGEVRAAMRQQVLSSLPAVTDRMRSDADGRTRFEYAVVGYLPEIDSKTAE